MAVEAVKAVEAALMAVKAGGSPSRSDGRGRIGVREETEGEREGPQGRAFQPDSTTLPSDRHSITPSSATAPLGPDVPQYFVPLTVR